MLDRSSETQPVNILLVEDDEVDRRAVHRAFKKLGVPVRIVEATDGQMALDILQGKCDVSPPPSPFLILLDINLPRMDGIEVLHKLRNELSDTHLKNAIVFILTTSEAEKDRERAYAHNIAGYLVKSAEKGGLSGIAEMLNAYHEVVVYP